MTIIPIIRDHDGVAYRLLSYSPSTETAVVECLTHGYEKEIRHVNCHVEFEDEVSDL